MSILDMITGLPVEHQGDYTVTLEACDRLPFQNRFAGGVQEWKVR